MQSNMTCEMHRHSKGFLCYWPWSDALDRSFGNVWLTKRFQL